MGGRLKAGLLLLGMYGLGTVTGIAWERYDGMRRPLVPSYPAHRLHHFYEELNLTPDQQKQMNIIFEKAHARATEINEEVSWDLEEIHHDSLDSIQQILTPEQRVKFEATRHRMTAHHSHQRPLEPAMMDSDK